ncbi:hypothetical protein N7495_009167 [Penicillium taxi]|uniref:uncharacterized protein n=1 Tax=Penicillium taxi TaxID=168475 RepID=UPI002545B87C|nr:uncharacterized protein N7495_009167 [Penicillium taxi]KAJ5884657.1 hypothetical protein N7495_009167 [Penicillium taxi]
MENPGIYSSNHLIIDQLLNRISVNEIPVVIRLLTQSTPSLQDKALDRFFTRNAEFIHPFCRVPSFEGSRWYIMKIFQWYKIMSPRIELEIHSVAFDENNLKLYVDMSQVFSIWLVPFHVAPVSLTTVLNLTTDPSHSDASHSDAPTNGDNTLYYITKQQDLYQTSEFVKFLLPHVGHWLVLGWQLIASLFCLFGVTLFWPILWLEENNYLPAFISRGNLACDIGNSVPEIKKD